MQFKLFTSFSEISSHDWNTLAGASIINTPFSRYEYLAHWWQTLGGSEWESAALHLVTASNDRGLLGIAPLFIAQHNGTRKLLLVGSIEISDYLDLIVQAEDAPVFINGLLDFLQSDARTRGMPIALYNVPESSPTPALLNAACTARGWTIESVLFRATPRIPLRGDFEAYLATVEKKQRHEIRRKMRRAADSGARVEFHIVQDGAELPAATEAFLELMAQDAEKAFFLKPAMRAHMIKLIDLAHQSGYLWLAFLKVDGKIAAGALNFDYANKLWGYNSGVNTEFMSLSPGWVLLAHQLMWATASGRAEFDFMRGDEEYKYRFGAINSHVLHVELSPRPAQ